MRPLGVVLPLERIEVPLLRATAVAHGLDGLAFERAMHPLVRAVLLGTARADLLYVDIGVIDWVLPKAEFYTYLKRLVDAGLLTTRNEGTYHYYAADYAALRGLTDYLWEDCCAKGKAGCC